MALSSPAWACFSTGTGLGGQLRGNAISRAKYSIDYATWFFRAECELAVQRRTLPLAALQSLSP